MEPLPQDLLAAFHRPRAAAFARRTSFRADTASTMEDAARLARAHAPHGTLVLADTQHAGRGRHGRTWADVPGQNLLVSLVWRTGPAAAWPRALLGLAVAVADTLEALGLAPRLKWPNDVRLGGRKVAGMIAHTAGEALVLGLGLNVNQRTFPPEIAETATSLALAAGRTFERGEVLGRLLERLEPHLNAALAGDAAFWSAYTARLDGLGAPIVLREGEVRHEGVFEAVAQDGGLVLRLPSGARRTLYAGDVTTAPVTTAPVTTVPGRELLL